MAKHIVKEIPYWDGVQLHQPGEEVEYEGKPSDNLAPAPEQPQGPGEGRKGDKKKPAEDLT